MYYSNMRCCHAQIGDIVKTSHHKDAMHYIVKRVEDIEEMVFLVPVDGSYTGEWCSCNVLFLILEGVTQ